MIESDDGLIVAPINSNGKFTIKFLIENDEVDETEDPVVERSLKLDLLEFEVEIEILNQMNII